MKDINEMNDHELLMELVSEKRRRDRIRYVKLACYGVLLCFVAYLGFTYVPKIIDTVNNIKDVIAKYDALAEQLQGTTQNIDAITSQFQDGTMEKLKSLVETLSSLLGRFGF